MFTCAEHSIMTKQEWNVAFDYVEHLKQQTFFFRPGLYVRLELRGVPCEFVTNFDPHYPLVVGGLLAIERSQSYLRARVKRHRWYKRILKVGYWWWRRRQTRRQRISVLQKLGFRFMDEPQICQLRNWAAWPRG